MAKTTVYTLENIKALQTSYSIVKRRRVLGSNSKPTYQLLEELNFELSNKELITIPKGFIWDLSSVPRVLWSLFAPDGDYEIASLIHDFLYITKPYDRKFADKEMLIWSRELNSTKNKWSIRNLDNWVRYYAVRGFGWIVWNKRKDN